MHAQVADYEDLAFDEDAISVSDAMDAEDRFIVERAGKGFVIRLARPYDRRFHNLVSKAELMELVDFRLERGCEVHIH